MSAVTVDENAPDKRTTAGKAADLEARRAEAVGRRTKAVDKQHAKGKKTARERIEMLLDEDSVRSSTAWPVTARTPSAWRANRPYGDGVVTGYGTIDGRPVCVFAQDFTVFGGSLGEVFGEKIVKVMDMAMRLGCPVIGLNDSGGARIQEGVVALGLYGEIFRRNVQASGVIPQISLIIGPCAGGAVYSPAITDFTIMVDKTSHMFITGPEVIKSVTGEDVDFEELGGAHTHNSKSGVAHYMAADEDDAIEYTKALLSYLPSNNLEDPPTYPIEADLDVQRRGLRARHDHARLPEPAVRHAQGHRAHPRRRRVPRDAAAVRTEHPRRLRPRRGPPGRHRREPADAVRRHARHRRVREGRALRAHLRRVQHPGPHVRRRARASCPAPTRSGTASSAAARSCIYAYAEATVPLITVITRKAYGGAYDVMGSKHLGADINLAWPTAEIAVMGAQGAVNMLYRKELGAADDPVAKRKELIDEYTDELANPYMAAERGYIDRVIFPHETRATVTRALRALRNKRASRPPKKHGNIPL